MWWRTRLDCLFVGRVQSEAANAEPLECQTLQALRRKSKKRLAAARTLALAVACGAKERPPPEQRGWSRGGEGGGGIWMSAREASGAVGVPALRDGKQVVRGVMLESELEVSAVCV